VLIAASFRRALVAPCPKGSLQLLANDALDSVAQVAPDLLAQRIRSEGDFTPLVVPDTFLLGVVLRSTGRSTGLALRSREIAPLPSSTRRGTRPRPTDLESVL
jgi:hypothetical protein